MLLIRQKSIVSKNVALWGGGSIHGQKIFEKNKFLHFVKTFDADYDGILHLLPITTASGPKMA